MKELIIDYGDGDNEVDNGEDYLLTGRLQNTII
jgi:hypothetical protein